MKKVYSILLIIALSVGTFIVTAQQNSSIFPFRNTSLSLEERVNDLVSRMTLQEKADQLLYTAGNTSPGCSGIQLVE